jgi:hypothetical protein
VHLPKKQFPVSFRVDWDTHARLLRLGYPSHNLAARAIVECSLDGPRGDVEHAPSLRSELAVIQELAEDLLSRIATLRGSDLAPGRVNGDAPPRHHRADASLQPEQEG